MSQIIASSDIRTGREAAGKRLVMTLMRYSSATGSTTTLVCRSVVLRTLTRVEAGALLVTCPDTRSNRNASCPALISCTRCGALSTVRSTRHTGESGISGSSRAHAPSSMPQAPADNARCGTTLRGGSTTGGAGGFGRGGRGRRSCLAADHAATRGHQEAPAAAPPAALACGSDAS